MKDVICVFGSGDARLPGNHIFRARLLAALDGPDVTAISIFGRHQPSMTQTDLSEAAAGKLFLTGEMQRRHPQCSDAIDDFIQIYDDDSIKSVAASCDAVVRIHLSKGHSVWLAMTWINLPRTHHLLRKAVERRGLNWSILKRNVRSLPSGGTFAASFAAWGALAPIHWLLFIAGREVLAWVKALRDPYDQYLNQNRTAPGA